MVETEIYCTECDEANRFETPHCPNCGAEDPWEERPMFQFDENDLPYIFTHETVRGDWDLWSDFCSSYWGNPDLTGGDVSGLPEEFPRLKYLDLKLYYVITEQLELEGPFLDRDRAREITHD